MSKILLRIVVSVCLISVVLGIIIIPRVLGVLKDQRAFEAIVLKEAPDYTLTPEIIGREVRASDMFVVSSFVGKPIGGSIKDNVSAFLANYQEEGLPAAKLIFPIRPTKNEIWLLNFPGCAPHKCNEPIRDAWLTPTDGFIVSKYQGGFKLAGSETFYFAKTKLSGFDYFATADVLFDYDGRVIKYVIAAHRETRTSFGKFFAQLTNASSSKNVRYDLFRRNLVLDREW